MYGIDGAAFLVRGARAISDFLVTPAGDLSPRLKAHGGAAAANNKAIYHRSNDHKSKGCAVSRSFEYERIDTRATRWAAR